jgi:hypothetical protein
LCATVRRLPDLLQWPSPPIFHCQAKALEAFLDDVDLSVGDSFDLSSGRQELLSDCLSKTDRFLRGHPDHNDHSDWSVRVFLVRHFRISFGFCLVLSISSDHPRKFLSCISSSSQSLVGFSGHPQKVQGRRSLEYRII